MSSAGGSRSRGEGRPVIAAVLVPLTMFGWILSGLVLCPWLGVRRGIAAVVVLGWLLLPMAAYRIDLFPAYDKLFSIALAATLALVVYDSPRLAMFRPGLIDLPMFLFCASPMATSIATGLGPYDGYTVICMRLLTWGFPYLIGRITFGTLEGMRDLALWIVIGGLVYAPLCLFEIKMSPQLSNWIYGIAVAGWDQTFRFGGWRPNVFLQHGLATGLFMCSAATAAVVMWRRKCVDRMGPMRSVYAAGLLVVIAVLCKSTGAIVLMLMALGFAALSRIGRSRIPVIVMLLLAPAYMGVRATGIWSGDHLVQAANVVGEDQAGSLQMRITNENIIAARAMRKPVLGWGTWSKGGDDESGFNKMNAVTDGYWTIVLGSAGFVGLVSFTTAMLLPALLLVRRLAPATLLDSVHSPAFAMAMIVIMFIIDCLFNAMPNPVFPVAVGGLAVLATLRVAPQLATGAAGRPIGQVAQRRGPTGATGGPRP